MMLMRSVREGYKLITYKVTGDKQMRKHNLWVLTYSYCA